MVLIRRIKKKKIGLMPVSSDKKGIHYINYGTNHHDKTQQSNAVHEYILTWNISRYIVKCKIVYGIISFYMYICVEKSFNSFIQRIFTLVNKIDRVLCPQFSLYTYIIYYDSTLFMDIRIPIAHMNFKVYVVNLHCFYNKNNSNWI